jgi:cytochrome c peroxidase
MNYLFVLHFFTRAFLEPIKQKHEISYSDLWTLAGCVAIEAMGGPKIPWRPGKERKEIGGDRRR